MNRFDTLFSTAKAGENTLLIWGVATIVAFVITLVLIYLLKPLAVRIGLVDHPTARKRHEGKIPLVGGIAMFLGSVAAIHLIGALTIDSYALLAAGTLLLLIGLADDIHDLPAKHRLLGQAIAALLVIFGSDIVLRELGDLLLFGTLSLDIIAIPITVFCFVGAVNAMNMVDGLDGLAGSLALVTISALLYLSTTAATTHTPLLAVLAGAIGGFLLLNARSPFLSRARVFMGDSGSMFLGGTIAALLIDMSQGPARAMSPVTALWIFAIPLMDTISLIIRRYRKGRSPFSPGRDHIHHILLRSGLSIKQTVAALAVASAALASIGILGQSVGVREAYMFFAFIGLFAAYQWLVMRGWRLIRLNRHRRTRRSKPPARAKPENLTEIAQIRTENPPAPASIPAAGKKRKK